MQSIYSKLGNFLEDVVNNIDTSITHLLQGMPEYITIAIVVLLHMKQSFVLIYLSMMLF
jgi:hypothetical protein